MTQLAHSSGKPCSTCNAASCYRWYKGPLCANCYRRADYEKNPEKTKTWVKAYKKRYPDKNKFSCKKNYQNNKEQRVTKVKEWIRKNQDKVAVYSKKSRENPENRKKRQAYSKQHYKENKSVYRAKDAAYRARKINATPSWANLEAIKNFYSNCPKGHHVDHIVPLQGKNICGLHVLENLQYLPAHDNLSKGNKYE